MLPTEEEALRELEEAERLNPGPWIKHSLNTGAAAKYIAEKVPGMDPEKAYIADFEARMGCSIYDVLPDIGKTSLLTPKPWKPPVSA